MISHYCLCGAACHVMSVPDGPANVIGAKFLRLHAGDGHGPATQAQAAAARRRANREETAVLEGCPT